ncbi:drug resistance transporter, EmrB/QacA subfamily [Asanoa ishikariensis]|uniref:Drug resistance transporter, EmrB/QacA subfamily n=2 Tax=Asanoa ishikariensis TaxID=137265 RepID=A0A1H3UXJ0_9ACTN|nr:drug resistance transporter, EmrB/QacA subfamily [Asanoa ishikariensis]
MVRDRAGQIGHMTAPSPLELKSAAGRGVLFSTILASGMAFLDGTIVNVALPHIGADLHSSIAGLQWTINGYLLTLAAFVLLGGSLGDRLGRRKIYLIGVVWFTVASVLCALSPTIGMLIGARFLQGAGAALLTPGSLAIIQASFRSEDRGRAIGLWSGFSGISTALGPFVGGYLIDALSWRWAFLINVPLGILAILASAKWVPESRAPKENTRFDVTGAVLAALALAGITFALIEAPDDGWGAPLVVGAIAIGVVSAVAFVLVERRKGDAAMTPPSLFRSRVFTVLNLYTVAVYGALSGEGFFLAVMLQNVAGYDAFQTGVATLPATVLMLLLSARSGELATRISPRWQLTIGPVVAAVGIILLRRIGPDTNYLTDVLPGVLLFGLGLVTLVAPLTTAVLGAVSMEHSGIASGVNNAAARAGALIAIAALPLLVGLTGESYQVPADLTSSFRSAMLWCAGLMVVGAALALVFCGGVVAAMWHRAVTVMTTANHSVHPVRTDETP